MWDREYRDYPRDKPLIKQPIQPNKGFAGCEMHEINGWGNTFQHPQPKKRGLIASLLIHLFSSKKEGQP